MLPPLNIQHNVPIPTWFKVGGIAKQLARPTNVGEVRRCLELDPNMRILGDGANLLVDDDGIQELVVSLADMNEQRWNQSASTLTVGAGVNLPKLITQTIRDGRGGLQVLGGIPASIGGAIVMNAGGTYGQIADVIKRVFAIDRTGKAVTLERREIDFSYRHSGLSHLIIIGAELNLFKGDAPALRNILKEVMAYKKNSQPMADNSAGCCFKNPTLEEEVPDIGAKGARISAGKLIDRAGCKGLRIRSASVSPVHCNFLTAHTGGKARDVIELMEEVERRVFDKFGVKLVREVVVWSNRIEAAAKVPEQVAHV